LKERPIIALMVSIDGEDRICAKQDYLRAVWRSGGIGVPLPYDESKVSEFCREFDGFIFCGGGDIDPEYYGEENTACCDVCIARDKFEFAMLTAALQTGKPILGICRGMQLLNVYFKGTLNQHISDHAGKDECETVFHEIDIKKGGKLFDIVDKSTTIVNSFHHQSVKRLGDGLAVDAVSGTTIEAFYHKGYDYCLAVQWHPEKDPQSEFSESIFASFIKKAKEAER